MEILADETVKLIAAVSLGVLVGIILSAFLKGIARGLVRVVGKVAEFFFALVFPYLVIFNTPIIQVISAVSNKIPVLGVVALVGVGVIIGSPFIFLSRWFFFGWLLGRLENKPPQRAYALIPSDEYERRQYERDRITASVRYDVLAADNFRCRICGRGAAYGVRLHFDHIIPISKGGTSDRDNLQTLCEDCNMGKSNKMPLFEDESEDEPLEDDELLWQ